MSLQLVSAISWLILRQLSSWNFCSRFSLLVIGPYFRVSVRSRFLLSRLILRLISAILGFFAGVSIHGPPNEVSSWLVSASNNYMVVVPCKYSPYSKCNCVKYDVTSYKVLKPVKVPYSAGYNLDCHVHTARFIMEYNLDCHVLLSVIC